ncbi:polyketide synthase [Thermothelomyces heterothallicus CBS 202.75]|uniref:polyketide synthase n=1 Tax=Thermothelomyces heterothallicus CBS 202.75 TaxID=1149848 RepID=UPI0037441D06
MAGLSQLIVFGDQAVPYAAELRRFIAKREDFTLAKLLSEAYHALRAEIARLPYSQRTQFPSSSTLTELLNAHCSSSATPSCALDSALACLHQIAAFVSYFNDTGKKYPKSPSTCLVGTCIGLLSAFAISCSESILDLVDLAPDLILLAFRLGLVVQNRTASVVASGLAASSSTTASDSTSVSYAVSGIDGATAASLVDEFCRSRSLAPAARVYVSAVGNGNVTVSGPPAQLRAFLSQHPDLKSARMAMSGLFHSAVLYDPSHIAAVLETLSPRLRRSVGRLDVVSNSEGDPLLIIAPGMTATAEQTLHAILSDILLRQMRWDLVTQRAAELFEKSSSSSEPSPELDVLPFAAGSVQGLAAAIRESRRGGEATVTVADTTAGRPRIPSGWSGGAAGAAPGTASQRDRAKIAIIGYSGRFPEADSNEEFWNLLLAGLDVVKEIPKDRFDPHLYCDPTGKKRNTSGVTMGCFVKRPDLFDARFFGMSPREAEQADPAQRLALMTAYEAMEMAGFVPDSSPSTQRNRIGVFYGTASDDYREVNAGQNVDTYFVPGGSRAFLPARINYHFRFSGPSFDVDTACSSGLAAVHIACNSLWRGDCDVAIAGGTNILTNPDNWAGLDRAHFLTRTGNCKTFDDGADGYCRAESVATVLLKRLDDALLDGDPIQAVILGALTNHSAEAVSITRPHSGAQRAIFSRILEAADVDSSDVSYVEMHGTGTQHGDACEMDSVLTVFAPDDSSRRHKPLYLGSAKANVGHAESASGVTSLIKVLLMMEKGQIPRHVGIKTRINRNFPTDLDRRNVRIAMQTTPWPRPEEEEEEEEEQAGDAAAPTGRKRGRPRRAFVNNFGAAGGNSSVLLEDAPPRRPVSGREDPRPLHVVAVSAKSQSALKRNMRALADHLGANPGTPIGSLAYTTTARRVHYNFRAAVTGRTIDEIRRGLRLAETKEHCAATQNGGEVPIAFCFTGQGAQYLGMGRRLLEIPQFRSLVVNLDEIARLQGFDPILPVIDGSYSSSSSSNSTTTTTTPLETLLHLPPTTVQLAMTCLQMALGKFWISLGLTPKLVVGHSLGEYAAMNIAGALSDADTIHLVGTRAALLEKHCRVGTHTMLAVKASASEVASLIAARARANNNRDGHLEICCANGPEETVVGGPNDEIESFASYLAGMSLKATQLRVQFAFHSAQVEPMLEPFRRSCDGVAFRDPSVPLLSPLLGRVVTAASDLGTPSTYLSRHCRETVNFCDSLRAARSTGAVSDKTVWLEIGPHPTCSNSLRASLASSSSSSSSSSTPARIFPTLRRGEDDWSVLVPTLASLYESGVALSWDDYHRGFRDNLTVLRLPSYRWDLKSYWIPYVHDWCLTKGLPPPPVRCNHHELTPPSALPAKPKEPFTISVQDLVEEEYGSDESRIVARSDAQHPHFAAILRAHRVNGQPVCSSAVFADMALTLFARLLEKSPVAFDKTDLGVEVRNMVADKSLILNNEPSQPVEMRAHVRWSTRQATFSLSSVDPRSGKQTAHHAKCAGTYSPISRWKTEWGRRQYLVQGRVAHLRQAVDEDDSGVSRIKTGLFYKLFGSLVDYEPSFRGCRELIMRSADFESTARVKFNTPAGTADRFKYPPYWLDSLGQITGFTMNANDTLDSDAQVFINHGWENMRLSEPLSDALTYQTYVKMQENGDRSYVGDVYVFNPLSDRIIAVYEGVTFSAVPRKILDKVLPRPAAAAATATTTNTATTSSSSSAGSSSQRSPIAAETPAAVAQQQQQQHQQQHRQHDSKPVLMPSPPIAKQQPAATSVAAAADKLRAIISEEVGAPVAEVVDSVDLADLGVDSLLALTLSDRILEELGTRVDSALFISGLRFQDLVKLVAGGDQVSAVPSPPAVAAKESSPGGRAEAEAEAAAKLRAIIAEEVGAPIADVVDDVELADLGVDSLLALTMADRILEELDTKVDSSLFISGLKFGDLVRIVTGGATATAGGISESSSTTSSLSSTPSMSSSPPGGPQAVLRDDEAVAVPNRSGTVNTPLSSPSLSPTPQSDSDCYFVDRRDVDTFTRKPPRPPSPSLPVFRHSPSSSLSASRGGSGRSGRLPRVASSFAAAAADRRPLLPSSFVWLWAYLQAVFSLLRFPDFHHLFHHHHDHHDHHDHHHDHHHDEDGRDHQASVLPIRAAAAPEPPAFGCPPATSVLLQGNPSAATKTLWLFPDGSGLAISYLNIPDLADDVVVYGLNSPFVKNTDGMDRCRFEDLISAYLAELRRRQPRGPYLVGGWSAGGLCAYRAAQRLRDEHGEEVGGLVLIDSPRPGGRKRLPARLYDEFARRGIFGAAPGRTPPAWLLAHFTGFSAMLDAVDLLPWGGGGGGRGPRRGSGLPTWIVWGADGVDEEETIEIRPDDPANMAWLLRRRRPEQLGANGWDALVGEDRIRIEVIQGANHFSLMRKPAVIQLGSFLRKVVS